MPKLSVQEALKNLSSIAEETTEGVFHCRSWGQNISKPILDSIEVLATGLEGGKSRLCLHPDTDDAEQQMLVAIQHGRVDPVHFHPDKNETLLWVKGTGEHRQYDSERSITQILPLGRRGYSYVNTPAGVYHHVVVLSEVLLFWEFSKGPFTSTSTVLIDS